MLTDWGENQYNKIKEVTGYIRTLQKEPTEYLYKYVDRWGLIEELTYMFIKPDKPDKPSASWRTWKVDSIGCPTPGDSELGNPVVLPFQNSFLLLLVRLHM